VARRYQIQEEPCVAEVSIAYPTRDGRGSDLGTLIAELHVGPSAQPGRGRPLLLIQAAQNGRRRPRDWYEGLTTIRRVIDKKERVYGDDLVGTDPESLKADGSLHSAFRYGA
jgi:hypothetical protein